MRCIDNLARPYSCEAWAERVLGICKKLTGLKHWREAKSALSTLSYLYDAKSDALDALGGLTSEEMRAVCDWATENGCHKDCYEMY